jgi:hypothetical protein
MPKSTSSNDGMVRYKPSQDRIIETAWKETYPGTVIDAVPWRRFPWFIGQKNYSGLYWSATEGKLVGYESRLELARLTMLDFDPTVKRIASQPFHLMAPTDGKRLRRTIDYLALTDDGPLAIDVKRRDELERPDVKELLERTRAVFESRGWLYEIASEPDEVRYANIKFLAGYRRGWLFEDDVLAEVRDSAASAAGQSIRAVLDRTASPRAIAKAALLHLLWTQELRADISTRLSMNTEVVVGS